MSSLIPGTGRRVSGISSWMNAQVCLSLRLSVACPPSNSTISLINCSSFLTRCAHTRVWHSVLSLAVPTTGTCLSLGTLHVHFRASGNTLTTTMTYSSNSVDPSMWTRHSAAFLTEGQFYLTHGDLLPHNILMMGRRLQLSSTGRLLPITPSFGNIARCMIRDGWRLHGDVSLPTILQVCTGRRRSGLYLGSFVISIAIICILDNVWGILI